MKTLIAKSIVIIACFVSSNALCVPGNVPNITLLSNYTLTWRSALNPNNCSIKTYFINILDNQDINLQFEVANNLSFNVSFLDSCKFYNFEVRAYTAESVLGPSYRLFARTALPTDISLNLTSLTPYTQNKSIQVSWNLRNPKYEKCVSYYQLSYRNESNHEITTLVNTKQFTVPGEIPACMNYSFEVKAIVTNPYNEGPVSAIHNLAFTQAPAAPTLLSIITTNYSVFMTWRLESYVENPCELLYLNVATSGVPYNSSYLQIPIMRQNSFYRLDTSFQIIGLQENDIYVSQVSVMSIGGASRNVTVTYQATDRFRFNRLLHLSTK